MRKLLFAVTLAIWSAGALCAQDIVGTWQGTLQPPPGGGGQPLRIVAKISRENDQVKVAFYSIDQGGQPLNASTVTFAGSNLKAAVPGVGGNYDGRLSSDGNTITGTWTQGAPSPLNLTRATPATAWAIPEPPPPAKPMAADASLNFEVATIKPSNPSTPGQSILVGRGGGNLFTTTNTTLNDLIIFAYGIHVQQIVGAPAWTASDKFDLSAKPEDLGIPNPTQLRTMVQKLLAERFGLKFHQEKKEMSAYTLNVGKNGPKMAKNESGGNLPGFGGRGPGAVGVRNSSMGEFASFLQARILDRPVVDQTGLTGKFDFTLEWRPDAAQAAGQGANAPRLPPEVEARPDMFTAFQEQIGLKLESMKTPVEVFVIDQVQKPSEN
jgi:uncharacterized protein (TIGR03435 family)